MNKQEKLDVGCHCGPAVNKGKLMSDVTVDKPERADARPHFRPVDKRGGLISYVTMDLWTSKKGPILDIAVDLKTTGMDRYKTHNALADW